MRCSVVLRKGEGRYVRPLVWKTQYIFVFKLSWLWFPIAWQRIHKMFGTVFVFLTTWEPNKSKKEEKKN